MTAVYNLYFGGNAAPAFSDGTPNILDYGVEAGDAEDQSAKFQEAVDANNGSDKANALYIPPIGPIRLDSPVIIPNTGNGGFHLFGSGSTRAEQLGSYIVSRVLNGPAFRAQKDGCIFEGFSMKNGLTSMSDGTVGIELKKIANTDDLDMAIKGVGFRDYEKATTATGRGTHITGCSFALCGVANEWSWPTDGTYGSGDNNTAHPMGNRAYVFEHNRVHTCDIGVTTIGATELQNALIHGNYCDLGTRLFDGQIARSVVANNIVIQSYLDTDVAFDMSGGGFDMQFTGNRWTGFINKTSVTGNNEEPSGFGAIRWKASATTDGSLVVGDFFSHFDDFGILVNVASENLTIAQCTFRDMARHGIWFANASLLLALIQDNQFFDYGTEASPTVVKGAIHLDNSSFNRSAIMGNAFKVIADGGAIQFTGTPTITGSLIKNNVRTGNAGDFYEGTVVDGGNNSVDIGLPI